ncbi:MAG TPA: hypothetical protein VNW52_00765 [Burkholderiaceae bacterium]|jgi:hypothetical protein|nr:hypothetical protein [Burkholderiaceae bacterium]
MIKKILLAMSLIGICAAAHADESNWRFYAGIGMTDGGDTIIASNITVEPTGLVEPFEIKAGTTTEFRVGADYTIAKWLSVQASIGHADNAPTGNNGSLDFKTTPIELLAFLNVTDALRIGGGLRKTHAQMSGTGVVVGWPGLGSYSSTRGSVVEAQYLFGLSDAAAGNRHNLFGLSVRAINETFTHDSVSFSGHHYEIGGAYYY